MCSHGRHHHSHENNDRRDGAHLPVPLYIEHAVTDRRRRDQNKDGCKRAHQRPASPTEKVAIAQHAGALIVVVRHFCNERGTGNLVDRDQGSYQYCNGDDIGKERISLQPGGRVPDKVIRNGRRQCRGIHEGMAPSPARASVVR